MKFSKTDKELNCQKYCLTLTDNTVVYRVVCDECLDCDVDNYEVEYYVDSIGNKIASPDITGAVMCSDVHVPHTYGCIGTRSTEIIPNSFGFDFLADFGTTDATDTYFHAVNDGTTTSWFPPATTSDSTPIVCTDVVAIQAFLDSIGSGITYTVNAFNEIVLFFANTGDESSWVFFLGNNGASGYTNKAAATQNNLLSDAVTYQEVQVIKYENIDGTYIDRFFIPSGGVLLEIELKPNQIFNFGECPIIEKLPTQRIHENFVITGITPLVIPAGAISISITKTNNSGVLNISADNSVNFPLTFNI